MTNDGENLRLNWVLLLPEFFLKSGGGGRIPKFRTLVKNLGIRR